jgi:hypothetical protein
MPDPKRSKNFFKSLKWSTIASQCLTLAIAFGVVWINNWYSNNERRRKVKYELVAEISLLSSLSQSQVINFNKFDRGSRIAHFSFERYQNTLNEKASEINRLAYDRDVEVTEDAKAQYDEISYQLALNSSKINALRIEVADYYDYEKFTMVDSTIARLNAELSAETFQLFEYAGMNEDEVVSIGSKMPTAALSKQHEIAKRAEQIIEIIKTELH